MRLTEKRGITDERDALEQALKTIEIDGLLGGANVFISGRQEPHLGDLAVYGTLRSIEGLAAHERVISKREGPLRAWYERMKLKVGY